MCYDVEVECEVAGDLSAVLAERACEGDVTPSVSPNVSPGVTRRARASTRRAEAREGRTVARHARRAKVAVGDGHQSKGTPAARAISSAADQYAAEEVEEEEVEEMEEAAEGDGAPEDDDAVRGDARHWWMCEHGASLGEGTAAGSPRRSPRRSLVTTAVARSLPPWGVATKGRLKDVATAEAYVAPTPSTAHVLEAGCGAADSDMGGASSATFVVAQKWLELELEEGSTEDAGEAGHEEAVVSNATPAAAPHVKGGSSAGAAVSVPFVARMSALLRIPWLRSERPAARP
jgi:hypothetical protein